MVSMLCLGLILVMVRTIIINKNPFYTFVGVVLNCALVSLVVWGVGLDLEAICLFLVVSGSLLSIFGFMLCLIPWRMGGVWKMTKWQSCYTFFGLVVWLGYVLKYIWGKVPPVSDSKLEEYDIYSTLDGEMAVILGLLLFAVMVVVVCLASPKGGALRRSRISR